MKVFFSIETVEGGREKFCKGSTILGVERRRRKSHDYFANIDITPTDENQEEVPEDAGEKNGLIDDNSINESRNEGIFLNRDCRGREKFCKGSTILGVERRRRKSHDYFANIDITPTDENQEEVPEDAGEKNGLIDDNSINESRNEGIFLNRDCRGREKFCKGSTILGVEYFQNIVIFKKKPYLQARVFPPK